MFKARALTSQGRREERTWTRLPGGLHASLDSGLGLRGSKRRVVVRYDWGSEVDGRETYDVSNLRVVVSRKEEHDIVLCRELVGVQSLGKLFNELLSDPEAGVLRKTGASQRCE